MNNLLGPYMMNRLAYLFLIVVVKISTSHNITYRSNVTSQIDTNLLNRTETLLLINVTSTTTNAFVIDGNKSVSHEVYINQSCNNDEECEEKTENSLCQDNQCVCFSAYPVFIRRLNRCIGAVAYNGQCSIDEECQQGVDNKTICKYNKVCGCARYDYTYFPKLNRCLKIRQLNQICHYDEECQLSMKGSECRKNRCRCSHVYFPEVKRCFRPAFFNESCTSNNECHSGAGFYSTCKNGYCNCVKYSFQDKNICKKARDINEACVNDKECESMNINSYCNKNRCNCQRYYPYHRKDIHRCMQDYTKCSSSYNCQIEDNKFAFCRDSGCHCPKGFLNNNDLPFDIILNKCNRDPAFLNRTCTSDSDCSYVVPDSYCKFEYFNQGGICKCQDSYYLDLQHNRCVAKVSILSEFCQFDKECQRHDSRTRCDRGYNYGGYSNKCQCNYDHYEKYGRCIKYSYFNYDRVWRIVIGVLSLVLAIAVLTTLTCKRKAITDKIRAIYLRWQKIHEIIEKEKALNKEQTSSINETNKKDAFGYNGVTLHAVEISDNPSFSVENTNIPLINSKA